MEHRGQPHRRRGARRRIEGRDALPGGARCDAARIDEIPFSSSFKYMATLDAREGGGRRLHVKGAPDRVLGYCDRLLLDGEVVELTEELRAAVRQAQADFAADALRVIAGAYRDMPAETAEADRADAEHGCIFAGLWGLMDPPRAEAAQAVAAAQRAGITVKMITGDHAATGSAIAKRVGILAEDAPATAVVTGAELDALDDDALKARVRDIAVFSRVEPRHKMRIVETLQELGEVVSMTGDGVNDAPALKRADIGVAMGITGTEVSKEAADMVLADDDFATIVSAVEEGRVIYGNLQRVVAFLVMVALGQVAAIAASQVHRLAAADHAGDGAVGEPRGREHAHDPAGHRAQERRRARAAAALPEGRHHRPARGVAHRDRGGAQDGRACSPSSATSTRPRRVIHAQTMAFTTLVAFEWAQAIGCRSWNVPMWKLGPFTNPSLVIGLLGGVALQWIAVSSPAAEKILGTDPLGPTEWAIAIVIGSTGLVLSAVMTAIERRRGLT